MSAQPCDSAHINVTLGSYDGANRSKFSIKRVSATTARLFIAKTHVPADLQIVRVDDQTAFDAVFEAYHSGPYDNTAAPVGSPLVNYSLGTNPIFKLILQGVTYSITSDQPADEWAVTVA